MILDHPLVSRNVFFPRPSDVTPSLVVEVAGAHLGCFVFRKHPDAGMLLYFHGNGELAADYAEQGYANMFLKMGVNVCFAEYRGYGASTGEPMLAAMLDDGQRIVEALGVPAGRLVAFGRSLGSLYAIELARRLPQLAGLIIESGIADVTDLLGRRVGEPDGVDWTADDLFAEARSRFDLQDSVSRYPGKQLILHAEQDQLLDSSHAERLHAWAGAARSKLVLFPNGNHNTILFANYPEYLREVNLFLDETGVTVAPPSAS